MKISGVYEIVNTITGDFYIGSSVDLDRRKKQHFRESTWRKNPNKPLYKDMKQYSQNSFLFKPIWLCDPEELKKYEQIAIEKYNPRDNIRAAYIERSKEEQRRQYQKQWYKEHADRKKQYNKEHDDSIKQYQKQYYKENADSIKQQNKQYRKEHADSIKQQNNQQCLYENELLSLNALKTRFSRQGIEHPTQEAKKYLIKLP